MLGGIGGLLLATAVGYWVLERSATHTKGNLKRVGQAVGWFIILSSVIGIACKVCALKSCPPGSKSWYCPFGSKASSPYTPPQSAP